MPGNKFTSFVMYKIKHIKVKGEDNFFNSLVSCYTSHPLQFTKSLPDILNKPCVIKHCYTWTHSPTHSDACQCSKLWLPECLPLLSS